MTVQVQINYEDSAAHQALIDEAAEDIRRHVGEVPSILIVAGSGLGALGDRVEKEGQIGYESLRHFPVSTVVGHAGNLIWGKLGGKRVIVMSGRKHVYEGVDVRQTIVPLRALIRAGVRVVMLSNAAGSLNRFIRPGDLMLINDHVALQFRSPLLGANLDKMGPRFPDMSAPYDPDLMELARKTAVELQIPLREGVYLALTGPTYESPAEVHAYRMMADAVGMSTVAETITAVHGGARVLAISAITNSHVLREQKETTHDEVIEVGKMVSNSFCKLIAGIIERL